MNKATPLYNSGLGRERIKQAEIDGLEAKIKVLQNNKQQLVNEWKPLLDNAQKEKNEAIKNKEIMLMSLKKVQPPINSNWYLKFAAYQNQLIEIASHPDSVISNKSKLELLTRQIKQDLSSSDILEFKKSLKQLYLLTKCLRATTAVVAYCRIIKFKISQEIKEESAQIDAQIANLREQIAVLRGYNLQHETTAESQRRFFN